MAVHQVDITGRPTQLPDQLPATGSPLWFEIRPNLKRSAVIASDILAALGKRRDVAGKGRNENQDVALALAWLQAYEIRALVALEAQNLTRLTLRHLVALAKAADVHLWLLHRPPRSDEFLRNLARVPAHPMRFSDVPSPEGRARESGFRPTLGIDDTDWPPFDRFRSALLDHVTPEQAPLVDQLHAETLLCCDEAFEQDGVSVDAVAGLLERIMVSAPRDDALVVGVRALQLAAWHHDTYIKADIPVLLASSERQLIDPVSIDDALVAYKQPHRPLIVALAAQQVGVMTILGIHVRDASVQEIHVGSNRIIPLREHTARASRAQAELRRREGAAPGDPLFPLTDRAVSTVLNQAALDFGIAVHGRRAERHRNPSRWLARLGITTAGLR